MLEQPRVFGAELRRLRIEAGLTLTQLAATVHYSKGQLSKIETGGKQAGVELARLCDAALDAGGRLAALVPAEPARRRTAHRANDPGEVPAPPPSWPTPEKSQPTAPYESPPPSRRQVIAVGAASFLAVGTSEPQQASADDTLLGTYRTLLNDYRRIGQMSPPDVLVPVLAEQTRALTSLAARSGSRTGRELLALASRFAEYTGWLAQETGDEGAALRWTAHAVELAAASGDGDLASYALVRRALITYYRGEAADTIALAEGARVGTLPPRIRGLATQRAAQGHAIAGDHGACMRGLDQARALLGKEPGPAGAPVLGPTHLSDPVSMITGWCLVDLGRPQAAAAILDEECARVPTGAWRTEVRYGVRRALAHALAGEIDHACDLTGRLLPLTANVASATVRTDLRRLSRTLARHPRNQSYLAIAPQLTAALTPAT
ncbi:helix-turn-helix transcriptional regulator [Streptomyces justiciae]|uniref:Helix-turn-helix transcriptional regulator n=1 Tax=Streptomyces justiciae TaxID=2780140 RepID=A0ABU3LXA0_9ACTN|nr:helix-turn-helix transcriptional regulator [Streptomyces justiciae]MDT7843876.1 helix-turn-helix transcriptional regulator [Streptomyces justiciae]